MSFTNYESEHTFHIDYIAQGGEANNAWNTLILDNSKGFTRAGVERINDSIRTYCWLILGSQSQTRTDILGTGKAFDAQKQFLANLEDAINSPVDLPSQIQRYQNTLKYARSKVDFVFGIGLYMCPSDMELRIGTIQDYNNEIVIATDAQELGLNNGVNTKPTPPKPNTIVQGTSTKRYFSEQPDFDKYARQHGMPSDWLLWAKKYPDQGQRWINEHPNQPLINQSVSPPVSTQPVNQPVNQQHTAVKTQPVVPNPPTIKKETQQHEDNKTALIVGSIVIGLTALIMYEIY
jgi:hypothetical protein